MTFEEACIALGWPAELKWISKAWERQALVDIAEHLTENGTKPADPQAASLTRAQVEMFG